MLKLAILPALCLALYAAPSLAQTNDEPAPPEQILVVGPVRPSRADPRQRQAWRPRPDA